MHSFAAASSSPFVGKGRRGSGGWLRGQAERHARTHTNSHTPTHTHTHTHHHRPACLGAAVAEAWDAYRESGRSLEALTPEQRGIVEQGIRRGEHFAG